ncbi:pilus assembly protein [Kineococcus terrestris]|uniref:pilus assembly protein n=1 Tax=Kineococcus terrestris TaxID=2044856 RepID=UPI0034DB1CF4
MVEGSTTGRDAGSAAVEFLAVGVLLLVPLAYLVLFLGRVQAATFAAEAGAREASRVLATVPGDAGALAGRSVELALGDQGFRADGRSLAVECAASPCRTPDALVAATVAVDVDLPLVPGFVADRVSSHVRVQVRRVAVADRFAQVVR